MTPESIVTIAEHKQFDIELMGWKRHRNKRLHHTQRHLTECTTEELKTWTLQHKKNMVKLLQKSFKNYCKYLKNPGVRSQSLITTYLDRQNTNNLNGN
jgi:hypothetical protein